MCPNIKEQYGFGFLFSNARLRQIRQTGAELYLNLLYADREEQTVRYDGVFYSQLQLSDEGKRIILAEQLHPSELAMPKHRSATVQLLDECGGDASLFDQLEREGYFVYAHYVGRSAEYLVIARNAVLL